MAFVGIDKAGREWIFEFDEKRTDSCSYNIIELPRGSIEKLTGRKLKRCSEPIDLSFPDAKECNSFISKYTGTEKIGVGDVPVLKIQQNAKLQPS